MFTYLHSATDVLQNKFGDFPSFSKTVVSCCESSAENHFSKGGTLIPDVGVLNSLVNTEHYQDKNILNIEFRLEEKLIGVSLYLLN